MGVAVDGRITNGKLPAGRMIQPFPNDAEEFLFGIRSI